MAGVLLMLSDFGGVALDVALLPDFAAAPADFAFSFARHASLSAAATFAHAFAASLSFAAGAFSVAVAGWFAEGAAEG